MSVGSYLTTQNLARAERMGQGFLTEQNLERAKPNLGAFETPENWMPTTQTYGTKGGFESSGAMGFLGEDKNGDTLMGLMWLAGAVALGYYLRGWMKK